MHARAVELKSAELTPPPPPPHTPSKKTPCALKTLPASAQFYTKLRPKHCLVHFLIEYMVRLGN